MRGTKKSLAFLLVVLLAVAAFPMTSLAAITSLDISPASIDFGTQQLGYDPNTLTSSLTITNTGAALLLGPITVTMTGTNSSAFEHNALNMYPNIPAAESRTFQVQPALGLQPGSYTAELHLTDMNTSATQDIPLSIKVKEAKPNAGIDYLREKLTGLTVSAGYNIGGANKSADASGEMDIDTAWFGNNALQIIKTNAAAGCNSDTQSLDVPARPAPPNLTPNHQTVSGGTSGIGGTTALMQYSTDNATWTDCGAGSTALPPGTYYVRLKATAIDFASATATLTVNAPNQHNISVSASPAIGGNPTASPSSAAQGDTINLTANPAANYQFTGWTVNSGGVTIANNSFIMPDNAVSVTANYTYVGGNGDDPDPGPTYTYRTLTDPATGISVSGYFTSNATLSVAQNALHSEGSCAACDEIRAQRAAGNVLVLYEISSGGHRGDATTVTIPVGSEHDGQNLTVLHCHNRTLEKKTFTVKNGVVTGEFTSLSPFAVLVPAQTAPASDNHNPDTGVAVPQTGDSGNMGLWIAMLAASLSLCVLSVWQLAKRRKAARR